MRSRSLSPLFTWRTSIKNSDLIARDKHVALTLSLYMNEAGDSAFPSLELLAADCSRSKSTISEALAELEQSGWLVKVKHGGGRGHRNHYEASVPEETVLGADGSGASSDGAEEARAGVGDALTAADGADRGNTLADAETVRAPNVSGEAKGYAQDEETVRGGGVKGLAVVPESVRTTSRTTAAAAELAALLEPDAAAGLEHELEQLQAGRTLRALAVADPDRALAWIQTAKIEADRNAAGFVRRGLESGEWPSRRGDSFRTASSTRSWIENTSWRLEPEDAHEILDERASTLTITSDELAELHRLVDDIREARAAKSSEREVA